MFASIASRSTTSRPNDRVQCRRVAASCSKKQQSEDAGNELAALRRGVFHQNIVVADECHVVTVSAPQRADRPDEVVATSNSDAGQEIADENTRSPRPERAELHEQQRDAPTVSGTSQSPSIVRSSVTSAHNMPASAERTSKNRQAAGGCQRARGEIRPNRRIGTSVNSQSTNRMAVAEVDQGSDTAIATTRASASRGKPCSVEAVCGRKTGHRSAHASGARSRQAP